MDPILFLVLFVVTAVLIIVIIVRGRLSSLEDQMRDIRRALHELSMMNQQPVSPPSAHTSLEQAAFPMQPPTGRPIATPDLAALYPPRPQFQPQQFPQLQYQQQPGAAPWQPAGSPLRPPVGTPIATPDLAALYPPQPGAAPWQPAGSPLQPPVGDPLWPPADTGVPTGATPDLAALYPPQPQFPPQPPLPYPPAPTPAPKAPKAPGLSFETLFGKNIVGIVASILVFIGLIFLGFLVVPLLSDLVKIVLMFVISAALTAGGWLLNNRYSNNFTKTLLGTGCGAFFIAIQITHLYFNAINDIAAFALLLVWIAGALFITRQSQSLLAGIIAHVGMIFSVCVGYAIGLSDDRVLLLMGYQLISTVLIVAGNVFCCKKLYRFGLFATLALTIYASATMWTHFIWTGSSFASTLPVALISGAFIVQFIGGSFLAYLLFVSIVRVKDSITRVLLQIANLLLWQISLLINVGILTSRLFELSVSVSNPYDSFPPALAIMTVLMYALALLIIVLRKALKFDAALEKTTVVFLVITSCFMLVYNFCYHLMMDAAGPSIVLLLIPAALSIGARLLSGSGARIYSYTALVVLLIDAVCMCIFGYWQLNEFSNVVLSVAYLLILLGLSFAAYRLLDQAQRDRFREVYKIAALLVFELSTFFIAMWLGWPESAYGYPLMLLLCLGALLALHLLGKATQKVFFRVNEFILIIFLCYTFFYNYRMFSDSVVTIIVAVINIAAVVCALALILNRIRLAAQANAYALRTPGTPLPKTDVEVVSALAIHGLALSTLNGLTGLLSQAYVLSLASMVIALVIIALGFWSRVRSLRLYGLVIVILCVLKLVVFDLGGLNTVMRVVAFIGGGIICFGISALYNFTVKRFNAEPAPPPPSQGLQPPQDWQPQQGLQPPLDWQPTQDWQHQQDLRPTQDWQHQQNLQPTQDWQPSQTPQSPKNGQPPMQP